MSNKKNTELTANTGFAALANRDLLNLPMRKESLYRLPCTIPSVHRR